MFIQAKRYTKKKQTKTIENYCIDFTLTFKKADVNYNQSTKSFRLKIYFYFPIRKKCVLKINFYLFRPQGYISIMQFYDEKYKNIIIIIKCKQTANVSIPSLRMRQFGRIVR
jgi:hypothetical protein